MNNFVLEQDIESIWNAIIGNLQVQLSDVGFQTFISSAVPISYENGVLTLEVPNNFSKQWIKEKCESLIQSHLLDSVGALLIQYVITDEAPSDGQLSIFSEPKPDDVVAPSASSSALNPKYTFDNFVVGHNNRFAHAASVAVGKAPSKAYNPLFIYGSVGLGKTHLLHAIGWDIHRQYPNYRIQMVSSEKFTNDLINAIKDKKTDSFRAKYRSIDVLIVDDVQFLAGKEQTQEEFFHTFNELHSQNKQIILTSDRPPKDIPTLELRLRTRFEWGLIADIQPPELETRIAILRKKNELEGFKISDEILRFIASQVPSNVREMEGALNRINAYAALLNTDVTLSIASNVIRDMVGIKQETPLSINLIKRKVCEYFQISELDLNSKSRTKDISYSRQIAMYLARELTHFSLPKIGENFGNRDHSTVMHACDKIKSLMEVDSETQNVVNLLVSQIRSRD